MTSSKSLSAISATSSRGVGASTPAAQQHRRLENAKASVAHELEVAQRYEDGMAVAR